MLNQNYSLKLLFFSFLFISQIPIYSQNEHQRIIGGSDADIADYPWQVAMVDNSASNNYIGQTCGGTIISENWILTAAHCVENVTNFDSRKIVAGITSLTNDSGQEFSIENIIIHPDYIRHNAFLINDIALIKLSTSINLDDPNVQAIPFATVADELASLFDAGVEATITGWGDDGSGPDPEVLQVAKVPIVSLETANTPESYNGIIKDVMLPAGYTEGGIDACQGDSGGPMVVRNANDDGWILAGITSWGNECAQPNFYGIYARVSKFEDWVRQHTLIGLTQKQALIISEIVDGSLAEGSPKYIEIHNASMESISLDQLQLVIYSNGNATADISVNITQGISLAPQENWVISSVDFQNSWGESFSGVQADQVDANFIFDGNDVIELIDTDSNLSIDVYGQKGIDGTATFWDYQNKHLSRVTAITKNNNGDFSESSMDDWIVSDYSHDLASPKNHSSVIPQFDVSILNNEHPANNSTVNACDGKIIPIINIENTGTTVIDSLTFGIKIGPDVNNLSSLEDQKIILNQKLNVGQTRVISLDEIAVSENNYLEITSLLINENADENTYNSIISSSFQTEIGYEAIFSIDLDEFPHENMWRILNEEGNSIYFFGNQGFPFDEDEKSTQVSETVCLPAGKYILEVVDTYGDGLDDGEGFSLSVPYEGNSVKLVEHGNSFESAVYLPFELPYVPVISAELLPVYPLENDTVYSCGEKLTAFVKVINTGDLEITELAVSYLVGPTSDIINWTGNIPQGDSTVIALKNLVLDEGNNTLSTTITSINNSAFVVEPTLTNFFTETLTDPILLDFELNTDDMPTETSWIIKNDKGNTIHFFQITEESLSNTAIQKSICFKEQGCYEFTVFDMAENGISNTTIVLESDYEDAFSITENFSSSKTVGFCIDDLLLGVEDQKISGLKIYPSPASQNLNIQIENQRLIGKELKVKLINLIGQTYIPSIIKSESNLIHLDLSHIPKGLYIVKIESELGFYTQKIIVE